MSAQLLRPRASPRLLAGMAGIAYLLNIATILLATFLFRGLFVSGDTPATANYLLAHEAQFRFGIGAEIISTACSIAVAALLYELFKPVSRGFSLLAAFFRLFACGIAVMGYALQLARVHVLSGVIAGNAHGPDQLQSLLLLLRNMHAETLDISIVFFGLNFLVLGALIVASKFLPRSLGVLVGIAGLAGLVFLAPRFATSFFPYFAVIGLLAESSLALWLTLIGVNVEQWKELVATRALGTALAIANDHPGPTIRDVFIYSAGSSA